MTPDDSNLTSLIRRHATRHRAGDALRADIRTRVALADAGRSAPRAGWPMFGWRAAALGFACGIAVALVGAPLVRQLDLGTPLEAELVADHVRALHAGPLIEVASSDRHTVKPWFQGRLDYAPPVFDLAADGFVLVGGRIEHVRGGAVAALAYTHNRHMVDLFVWPADAARAPARTVNRGFNVVQWADASMQYWAVSDADRAEIERFAQALRARAAAQ